MRQAAAGAPAPPPREADVIDPTDDALDDILNLAQALRRGGKNPLRVAVALKRKAQEERDEARAETKRVQAGKGVAVLSTTTECYERINQLDRRLTKFADCRIELGADPDDVNEPGTAPSRRPGPERPPWGTRPALAPLPTNSAMGLVVD